MNLSLSSTVRPSKGFRNILRAGWFPFLLAMALVVPATFIGHQGTPYYSALCLGLMVPGIVLLLDMAARISDYLYYSTSTGATNAVRIMTVLRKSFCSRQVGVALYGETAKKFYHSLGYRWYHLTPDGALRKDSVFFRINFWRKVFGI